MASSIYSPNYPKEWIDMDSIISLYNEDHYVGKDSCNNCKSYGCFEGVFYGLCSNCSSFIYEGKHGNLCEFILEIQTVVDELRREYPNDEYGIVSDAIDAGHYILNIRTKTIYEHLRALEIEETGWEKNVTDKIEGFLKSFRKGKKTVSVSVDVDYC